jgi:hypothetical protein
VNPINKAGRVRSDAEYYELPYDVLIGADSEVISDYQIIKLPRLIIVGKDGKIRLTESFVAYDKLKKEVERVVKERK